MPLTTKYLSESLLLNHFAFILLPSNLNLAELLLKVVILELAVGIHVDIFIKVFYLIFKIRDVTIRKQ